MRLPRRSLVAAIHDITMAALSLPLALYLRLGDEAWAFAEPYFALHMLVFMACFVGAVFAFSLQREVWRYVSINELTTLARVVTLSIVLTYAALFLMQRLEGIPRSLPLLHWMVLGALLSIPRVLYRHTRESGVQRAHMEGAPIYVIIAGANDHAEAFIRTLQRGTAMPYQVVAIVDRKQTRHGRSLRGIPIHAGMEQVERVIGDLEKQGKKPQRLILTEEYMDAQVAGELVQVCERQGVGLARLPRLTDVASGAEPDIRPVAIDDLLGRAQSHHDSRAMRHLLGGKVVLVTGAGGSIGAELVRQIAACQPAKLVLLDHSEFNLYQIDRELAVLAPELERRAVICNVRDVRSLVSIMQEVRPAIVFHAAALKHVPLAETNPEETILTNVFGTRNVAEAAISAGAQSMVLISTDKAVHPANVMGASKRLAEYVWAQAGAKAAATRMVMVRFGNVLGSTGSVIPLFQEQLQAGGPLTVTHPEMERYFMTMREAAGLVIQAAAQSSGDGAALYILDMGRPVKIVDLACQMIRLAGYEPHKDIDITYTGLRSGEKLTEELIYAQERLESTSHPSIRRSRQVTPLLPDTVRMESLHKACLARDKETALMLLRQLVQEFAPTEDAQTAKAQPQRMKDFA